MTQGEYDIVIRGGAVADGSGGPIREGDVAVQDGIIVACGSVKGRGREEIDAKGQLVTPGFVDVHTHYDGQITWDNRLAPSSVHGVTTVVMGNCGVGFAPCRPADRELLVELMEGVEDIPESVMAEGLPWNWESFPDYLDAIDRRRCDVDFAAQIPHSPIRVFAMGQRGADHEPPNEADLDRMTALVAGAIRAGALGVSTSRSLAHRTPAGKPAPSVFTEEDELIALGNGLREAGSGVFQIIPRTVADDIDPAQEMGLLRRIAEVSGRPLSFTLLHRSEKPEQLAVVLDLLDAARADGLRMSAQVAPRPVGVLQGLDLSFHPFRFRPSFNAIADLPLPERVAAMRDPELRARLLAETNVHSHPMIMHLVNQIETMCELGDPPNYEPRASDLLAPRAAGLGISPAELAYDLLVANDGTGLLMLPASNYVDHSLDAICPLLLRPGSVVALGDGGAHYGNLCDASYPTTMLAYWARDRQRGPRLDLAPVVRALTRDPALAVGLGDRGLLAPGYKADLNIIDHDRLRLYPPAVRRDLPAGGRRLYQRASGYTATIVNGVVTYREGEATGALPGRLVRGARDARQGSPSAYPRAGRTGS